MLRFLAVFLTISYVPAELQQFFKYRPRKQGFESNNVLSVQGLTGPPDNVTFKFQLNAYNSYGCTINRFLTFENHYNPDDANDCYLEVRNDGNLPDFKAYRFEEYLHPNSEFDFKVKFVGETSIQVVLNNKESKVLELNYEYANNYGIQAALERLDALGVIEDVTLPYYSEGVWGFGETLQIVATVGDNRWNIYLMDDDQNIVACFIFMPTLKRIAMSHMEEEIFVNLERCALTQPKPNTTWDIRISLLEQGIAASINGEQCWKMFHHRVTDMQHKYRELYIPLQEKLFLSKLRVISSDERGHVF
ncbi:unnamed protein product [Bursaphelenchus okinawaensis]|uniref:Galectin n=1 Tax=Bursaphelenchus okinawaensis TaxID=465554 RepID=A0A811LL45_9BILA|nr:unnamed protein product [Bursaphelenchus okinawaensis]CAG9127708.1 unnamed protein product [Bursaphelenchus okinawaensis]